MPIHQIYDQLVMQLPGFTDPQPGLAETWDVSDDNLTYTFHLRDAKFSDGSPVTADDVKFSMTGSSTRRSRPTGRSCTPTSRASRSSTPRPS
jgi:peptide/nickel transport system substrate-binding protein